MNTCKRKTRKGLTLAELVGVMIIVAVLISIAGMSVSANVKRGNRETVVSELELYATSISDAYYDMGSPDFDPTTQQAEFETYLGVVEKDYLNVVFDYDSIEATSNGFTVEIKTPVDVFERPYKCWFVTAPDVMKYIMVVSGGENGKIEPEGYNSQDYKDDIVLIVRPKI